MQYVLKKIFNAKKLKVKIGASVRDIFNEIIRKFHLVLKKTIQFKRLTATHFN